MSGSSSRDRRAARSPCPSLSSPNSCVVHRDRILARAYLQLYGEEDGMATSSETYVGIDVSKDRLDVAILGQKQLEQVCNSPVGIKELVQWMQELQPALIVVEATGGYQRAVVEALFMAGL